MPMEALFIKSFLSRLPLSKVAAPVGFERPRSVSFLQFPDFYYLVILSIFLWINQNCLDIAIYSMLPRTQ